MRPSGRPAAVRPLCACHRQAVASGARARSARGKRPPAAGLSHSLPALGGWPAAPAQPSLAAPSTARQASGRAVPVPCFVRVRPPVGSSPLAGAPLHWGSLRAALHSAGQGRGAPLARPGAVSAPPGKGKGQGQDLRYKKPLRRQSQDFTTLLSQALTSQKIRGMIMPRLNIFF